MSEVVVSSCFWRTAGREGRTTVKAGHGTPASATCHGDRDEEAMEPLGLGVNGKAKQTGSGEIQPLKSGRLDHQLEIKIPVCTEYLVKTLARREQHNRPSVDSSAQKSCFLATIYDWITVENYRILVRDIILHSRMPLPQALPLTTKGKKRALR